MPRYFLEIAFDGSGFKGWQNQPRDPSVQQQVERAIAVALHLPEIDVVGCGRTDSGVHARQFFLHFDTDEKGLGERFVRNLNGILPDAIAVRRVLRVRKDAHARFDATARTYIYQAHTRKDPFLLGRSYRFHRPLDVAAMDRACKVLIGKKDFAAFQKSGSDNKTTTCTVRVAKWTRTEDGCMFTITADRFLRNMVRAIVGTSLRIGTTKEPVSHMRSVLLSRDRSRAGKSAPADGLYLERVVYPFLKG
jgi:tRNA pseudouridine38-40 synthase